MFFVHPLLTEGDISLFFFTSSFFYNQTVLVISNNCNLTFLLVLPPVGKGGMPSVVGATVVGSSSFFGRSTKTKTTMRMITRIMKTISAVTILHLLELKKKRRKIQD